MKNLIISFTSIAVSIAFLGCAEKEASSDTTPPPTDSAATTTAVPAAAATPAPDDKAIGAPSLQQGEAMLNNKAQMDGVSQISSISDYSKSLNSSWDSIKGMDFAQKASFLQQVSGLVSSASEKIDLLKQVAPMISGDTGKALLGQIPALSGQLGNLSSLVTKGAGITSGDWGSYKGQIGSAIQSLSGGFSGLDSLIK